jgi:urease accessory protein
MQRATQILAKGSFRPEAAIDRVVLDFEGRYRRRIVLNTDAGRRVLLDLKHATRMSDGDALETDMGMILIVAEPEHLLEITAPDRDSFVRIAWHLGNRHVPTQLLESRLRIRFDHVMENLVQGLGGTVGYVTAPFDPEGGAYDAETAPHEVAAHA